jgi:uncharacterized protein
VIFDYSSIIVRTNPQIEIAMNRNRPEIPSDLIEDFCKKHHIKKLAIFGSYLREDFGPESDIDFLVEFDREHIPTLLDVAGMEMELSQALSGRKVDLRTPRDLSRYFRDQVVAEAEVQYAER